MQDLQSSPLTRYVRRTTSIPTFRVNVTLFVARICWQSWHRPMLFSAADVDAVADVEDIVHRLSLKKGLPVSTQNRAPEPR